MVGDISKDHRGANRTQIRQSLAKKLMIAFLSLFIVSFSVIGLLAVFAMGTIGEISEEHSVELGKIAAKDSTIALERLGEAAIKEKALDIAEEVRIYLSAHLDLTGETMGNDPELVRIGVQPVGQTGYTCVYERGTAIMRLHPNPDLVNYDMRNLQEELPTWWTIYAPSLTGAVSGGYYDWSDADGNIRPKFMYMVPVNGTSLMVAATTYIDEFSSPAKLTAQAISAATNATNESINREITRTMMLFVLIFLIVLGAVACIVLIIARMITGPIRTLTQGTEIIGGGNLDFRVEVRSGDELEVLAGAINQMASDLKEYTEELIYTSAEKERIAKELEIARGIQQSFLPEFPPQIEGFDLAALNLPAREVGGDFYDFIETIHRANDLIAENDRSSMFVTLFYGVLDPMKKTLTYVSAGHNWPFMLKSGSVDTILLKAEGVALGVMPKIALEEQEISLDSGDIVVLYTDGVTEAINRHEVEFGVERLTALSLEVSHLPASEIITRIKDEVTRYSDDQPQFDDLTLMVLKVL
ncbi:MAG: PP2C family protein-serine/threonine phosphatase [Methanomicrobiales archaeon]|nr:PP2C family protein-serine/threonine phosphatase [Methanomicrobiales archaeon]